MTRRRVYLIVQAALCAAVAGWLAAAVIRMYMDGAAAQAGGELFRYIYTREAVGAALRPMLPLIFTAVGMTAAGLILGVRGDERPPRDLPAMALDKAVPQAGSHRLNILRVVVLVIAVALIAAGVANGGLEDVLTKANAICMECVGLG
ncbi:MAG: hypothetical protein IJ646_01140 [Clostridia bacterium]|nr:hypothetical protein [Clostridia bacterium]